MNAQFLPPSSADPALAKRGELLAKVGSAPRQIQACEKCHAPSGGG
jgi:hypothetical protein